MYVAWTNSLATDEDFRGPWILKCNSTCPLIRKLDHRCLYKAVFISLYIHLKCLVDIDQLFIKPFLHKQPTSTLSHLPWNQKFWTGVLFINDAVLWCEIHENNSYYFYYKWNLIGELDKVILKFISKSKYAKIPQSLDRDWWRRTSIIRITMKFKSKTLKRNRMVQGLICERKQKGQKQAPSHCLYENWVYDEA